MRIVWFLISAALALVTYFLYILTFQVPPEFAPWVFSLSIVTTSVAFGIPFYAKAK